MKALLLECLSVGHKAHLVGSKYGPCWKSRYKISDTGLGNEWTKIEYKSLVCKCVRVILSFTMVNVAEQSVQAWASNNGDSMQKNGLFRYIFLRLATPSNYCANPPKYLLSLRAACIGLYIFRCKKLPEGRNLHTFSNLW